MLVICFVRPVLLSSSSFPMLISSLSRSVCRAISCYRGQTVIVIVILSVMSDVGFIRHSFSDSGQDQIGNGIKHDLVGAWVKIRLTGQDSAKVLPRTVYCRCWRGLIDCWRSRKVLLASVSKVCDVSRHGRLCRASRRRFLGEASTWCWIDGSQGLGSGSVLLAVPWFGNVFF